jgi:predicted HTH domain antitoxin
MFTNDGGVNGMKTVTVSMRMDQAEVEDLERLADEMGLDRSTFLKQVIRRGCQNVLLDRACAAYRRGEVTLSKAAQMARISVREMLLRMPQAGLELNYTVQDLQEDLA